MNKLIYSIKNLQKNVVIIIMNELGTFPFGNPVRKVEQKERTPKKVFVLGIYSNAVNAQWFTPDEKTYIARFV